MNITADTNLLPRAIVADDPDAAEVAQQRLKAARTVTIRSIAICEKIYKQLSIRERWIEYPQVGEWHDAL